VRARGGGRRGRAAGAIVSGCGRLVCLLAWLCAAAAVTAAGGARAVASPWLQAGTASWLQAEAVPWLRAGTPSLPAGVASEGDSLNRSTTADLARLSALLASLDSLPPSPSPPRLALTSGLEVEGSRESFGFESLFDAGGSDIGSIEPTTVRYRERETQLRALLGLEWQRPHHGPWDASAELATRWGEARRSLTFGASAACDSGRWAGWSLRELLLWDDEDEGEEGALRSVQNLLYLRRRPVAAGRWEWVVRGTLDRSWAEAKEAADEAGVYAAYAGYLDYTKASFGCGRASGGLDAASLYLDLERKWIAPESGSAYTALAAEWSRARYGRQGLLDGQLRLERRHYVDPPRGDDSLATTSALRSFYEAESYVHWERTRGGGELEATARLTGNLYDEADTGALDDTLGTAGLDETLNADRLRLECDLLASREWVAGPNELATALGAQGLLARCATGVGPVLDRLWTRGGAGDFRGLGVRTELSAAGGAAAGDAWCELSCEVGQRWHDGDGGLVFDLGTGSFSLAQTDYRYVELALIGAGALPRGWSWELYAFFDHEWHSQSADDIELFTVRGAIRKRWALIR